ncbi:MAG: PEP-CTERM sorting domain-containing protein [Lentisphaeria bacterium]|nr:PEP-CTERM sorting domain-containing protein [Lentisphaeria bacterium]
MFKKLFGMIACLALASSASAATLISWDFSNIVDANQPATGTVVTNVNSGILLDSSLGNAATGLSTSHLLGGGNLIYSDGNDADGELNVKGWDGDSSSGGDGINDGWMQFTLTAGASNTISLTGLSISSWRNGPAAPDDMIFHVDVDSAGLTQFGSTQLDSGSGDGTFATYSFTDLITGASEIEIRFAPVGPSAENGRGDGNLHINALTVSGSVVTPSTISLDLNSTNSGDINLAVGDNEFDFNATNGGSGLDADYLIVAGGGGGGAAKRTTGAGGGGAGGLLEGTTTLTGAEGIVVGDGGDGGTSPSSSGTNGDDSSAFGETAIGGGGGASSTSAASMKGNPGGSGGGGSADTGGSGTALQGNAGGNSTAIATGGGGGGAGGVGGTPTGGDGLPSTITGTSVDYAAGGDGNVYSGAYADGANGAVNTGNGGGGAKSAGSSTIKNGGKGGSGIVVVRYTGDNLLTGGTVSTVGADTVHTFTSVGSSTLGFNATIDGDISGDGNLIWNGGGTLTLNGTNTYTGTTTIDSGSTLQIGSGGTTGTLPTGDVLNNGALVFNRSDITTITNDVSGTGSVEHAGSGTLELTGTLTYDGPTSVTGGGILEMASGSFGALSVGNGTLSIDSSGIGEINLVANSLTLNNGATIDWQFTDSTDGNYDQIVSTAGDLLGSGTITIHVSGFGDYSVSKGDRFKLYDGTVSEGAFDNFAFVFSGDNYQYWTMELGSLDIVSTIPEPSTAILAGLGLAGMCLRRRKRK